MLVQPTLAPRAEALWERQQNPADSFFSNLSTFFNGPGNTDSIVTSSTPSSTSSQRTTSTTSSSSTRSTSSSSTPTSTSTTSSSTSSSTTSSSTTSSTPTSTRTTSSASSTVITTSSPTTVVSTSNLVSGTSTSQVVVTTVVTPVVTATVAPDRTNFNRSSSNGALIGGVVGGVVGGLALLALLIVICVMASRRRSRTGHAYFLCFGERPSRAAKGELGHSGGAWPTFDPVDDYGGPSFAAGAAGAGAAGAAAAGAGGAAAIGSRNRRRRREQTNATLPAEFANEEDPERYGYNGSSAAHHTGYGNYDAAGYDAYNNGGYGASAGYSEMQEHGGRGAAGALAAGAAAGGAGAYLYNNASPNHNRRSSAGHPSYGSPVTDNGGYGNANMSPHGTATTETAPAPWTLPMMGWQDTHGPYSVAGVGQNIAGSPPQAQFMVSSASNKRIHQL